MYIRAMPSADFSPKHVGFVGPLFCVRCPCCKPRITKSVPLKSMFSIPLSLSCSANSNCVEIPLVVGQFTMAPVILVCHSRGGEKLWQSIWRQRLANFSPIKPQKVYCAQLTSAARFSAQPGEQLCSTKGSYESHCF